MIARCIQIPIGYQEDQDLDLKNWQGFDKGGWMGRLSGAQVEVRGGAGWWEVVIGVL